MVRVDGGLVVKCMYMVTQQRFREDDDKVHWN